MSAYRSSLFQSLKKEVSGYHRDNWPVACHQLVVTRAQQLAGVSHVNYNEIVLSNP